uniref:Uncharacterized protein n=1 Tax=Arundo donax TaxID=35708 RepID=A0A0A8ZPE8_ARUDO
MPFSLKSKNRFSYNVLSDNPSLVVYIFSFLCVYLVELN